MRIVVQNHQSRPILSRSRLRRIAGIAADAAGVACATVGMAFVSDDAMTAAHERFLGKASTTDVLSFPGADDGATPDGADDAYLGDVFICTDQAVRQARELRHPYPFELVVLALHGTLHLLGYDHTTDDGRMARTEDRLRPLSTRGRDA